MRKGNPKHIKDWGDLMRSDMQVIMPNPKTSGGARRSFLAAYAWALDQNGQDMAEADAYARKPLANVSVLGSDARDSTITFTCRGIGDVLLAWENEVFMALEDLGLEVQPRELLALLGPSGSGMTALLCVIAGEDAPGDRAAVALRGGVVVPLQTTHGTPLLAQHGTGPMLSLVHDIGSSGNA